MGQKDKRGSGWEKNKKEKEKIPKNVEKKNQSSGNQIKKKNQQPLKPEQVAAYR